MNRIYCLRAIFATICLILALSSVGTVKAAEAGRKDSINVWGKVRDFFTGEKLDKGIVTVYNEQDSVIIVDSIRPAEEKFWGTYKYNTEPGYRFKLPRGGNYKIRFDVEGYVSDIQVLKIPDRQYYKYTKDWMADFKLRKKPKEHVLGGATVRATRIKMVVRGDTVEYNADAFNVAEGSMLDKLIDAMPGMQLKDNGEIYHNGKKVESLLVNGKDFFDGDPKLALENLPAYTVKKVQVYRKDNDASYLIKDSLKREEMKKLVLDVKLKKEYSQGWIVNTDFAYGTQDRFITRASAMYFADVWKFLGFFNINNINLRGGVGNDADFWGESAPQGLHRYKSGGFRVNYSKAEKLTAQLETFIDHSNDFNQNESSGTTFLTSGDTYSRMRSDNRNTSTNFNIRNWTRLRLKKAWLGFTPLSFSYSRSRGSGNSLSATFNADPLDEYRCASLDSLFLPMGSSRLEAIRLNTVLNATQSLSTSKRFSSDANLWCTSPIFGNTLGVGYNFSYSDSESSNYKHYLLDNKQTTSQDKQNVFAIAPRRNVSFNARLNYNIDFEDNGGVDIGYVYDYSQDKNTPERYRLDSLSGWDDFDKHGLGQLPSTRDSMLVALDLKNSYHTTTTKQNHLPKITGRMKLVKNLSLTLDLPLKLKRESISDTRYNAGKRRSASIVALEPQVGLELYKDKEGVITMANLRYNNTRDLPSLHYLLDLTDDTNPLFVSKGNPNLKNRRDHNVRANFSYSNAKHMQNYGVGFNFWVGENQVASTTTYDRATGITTYMPRNINGNWTTGTYISFSRSVDKNDRFTVRNNLSASYNHNVDYISDGIGEQLEPTRSVVHNTSFSDDFQFTYRHKERMVSLRGNVNWRIQNSSRQNFNKLSAVDFNYGVRSHGPIVWGFEYETNLMVYSRRGYSDPQMNDNHIVWDLKLSRSFLKGKPLTLRLELHDLLSQLSNVRTNVNSQGRTETWYNSIPRYGLLHVCYKFNTMARKKEQAKK